MNNYIKLVNAGFDKNLKKGKYLKEIYKNGVLVSGGRTQRNFAAAGIIPYSIKNGEIFIFLNSYNIGKSQGIFTYFGGKRESSDGKSSRQNAIREAYEESYDIANEKSHLPISKDLYDRTDINDKMRQGDFYVIPKLNQSNKKWNNIYFVKIEKEEWKNHQFDEKSYVLNNEIREIKWFSLNDIFKEISSKKIVNFIASVLVNYYQEIKKFT